MSEKKTGLPVYPGKLGRLSASRCERERGGGNKESRERISTHGHVFAPVSREGLFILQEDAVTRFPARLSGSLANAAFGFCKKRKIVPGE